MNEIINEITKTYIRIFHSQTKEPKSIGKRESAWMRGKNKYVRCSFVEGFLKGEEKKRREPYKDSKQDLLWVALASSCLLWFEFGFRWSENESYILFGIESCSQQRENNTIL